MKNFYAISIMAILFLPLKKADSQEWFKALTGHTDKNFYEIQQDFNEYTKNIDLDSVRGWKQYKRWEWFWEPRVYPTGEFPKPDKAATAMEKFYKDYTPQYERRSGYRSSGNWTSIGPKVPGRGIGRINFITFHPNDPNTMYIGAPSGGMWFTEDGGLSWATLTDKLPVIGFSDMIINPLNPDIMYLASSDGDAYDTYSIGVIKSHDGGKTWQETGLDWKVQDMRRIRKLLMHPNDTSVLFAATSVGIYKTENGGQDWKWVASGSFRDIEFRPGNPDVIYAGRYGYSGSAGFYRSTDGGSSFQRITDGLPSNSTIRFEIAVTPADTSIVYVVVAKPPNTSSLRGVYKSSDGGSTFRTIAETPGDPNLLGRYSSGADYNVGQGWYDLDIIANPSDSNEVFVGGINIWKTEDGGDDWELNAHWTGAAGKPYVHADIHAMEYYPGSSSTFFVGCDGGIYKTTDNGKTYTDLSNGLVISQIYRIGISNKNPDLYLAGLQDNGTKRGKNGSWSDVNGGDGFECIINYQDNNIMYASSQYGNLYRSTNGGSSFNYIKGSINETGAWLTPYVMDPTNPNILYAGYSNIWKTIDKGSSWSKISNFTIGSTFDALAVAPSNTSYIYASKDNQIMRTTDGGTKWESISLGLPNLSITYIAVHPEREKTLWVTLSSYSDGEKIYVSTDAGDSWINYSGSLPNLPANCVVYEKGSDNGLYVGMDVGVYYRDSSMNDWQVFNEGLPNVIINELEIFYADDRTKSRIRAGTYGRGIWESELFFPPNTPPIASFEVRDTHICVGYTNSFTNKSSNAKSFEWYFPGGSPSYSTDRNPHVVYDSAGKFDVILKVFNEYGRDSIIQKSYLHVDPLIDCEYVMPVSVIGETYSSCRGTLYDPGGNQNYYDNTNSYVTIAPAGASKILLNFSAFEMEEKADSLCIYEGKGVSGKLLGCFSGNDLPGEGLLIIDTSAVTIRLISDAAITREGFVINWRCVRDGEKPFAYFKSSERYNCTGSIQFSDQSFNTPGSWTWYFDDGNISTDKNPVHQYQENGSYDVKLIVSNSFGTDSFVFKNLVIDMPELPETIPASRCGSGQLTLSAIAEAGDVIKWYSSDTGTTVLHTGANYLINNLNAPSVFYAQKYVNGPSEKVGIPDNTLGDGGYYSGSNGLVFDVQKAVSLVSVKAYALGDANRRILVENKNGDTIFSKSYYMSNGENRVKLNLQLDPGTSYVIKTGNKSTLWRTREVSFPYKLEGIIEITKALSGSDYFFFYDWEVQQREVCRSRRVAVEAGVFNNAPKADFSYKDSSIYVSFSDESTDPFSYLWDFGDGQQASVANPEHKYGDGGEYDVKLVVTNGCGQDSVTKQLSVVNQIAEKDDSRIRIYPNPNKGSFILEYGKNDLEHVELIEAGGKVIYRYNVEQKAPFYKLPFDISSYPAGIYVVKVISSKQIFFRKILVQ